MSTTQWPQPRDLNNENDVGMAPAALDVNKDDPSLSDNALMIIVISVCCFIAIVIIFIIIGFCYTKRPSAYEIHPPNPLQLTSREGPQVRVSA